MHHHKWPSVLIVDAFPNLEDYTPDGKVVSFDAPSEDAMFPVVEVTGPQPTHAAKNIDTTKMHLYRIEFKKLAFRNLPGPQEN